MTCFETNEIRLCTAKTAVVDPELRAVTAFVVHTTFGVVHNIPGDAPTSEPEVITSDKPVRCYKAVNGDPNNRTGLVFVLDLSDVQFQELFDYTDAPGV